MPSRIRQLGWLLIAVVVAGSLASDWFSGPSPTEIRLTDSQLATLSKLDDTGYSSWLTNFADKLDTVTAKQVLLLQGIPAEQPLVIATTEESDGDEEPTHWRVPWPAVADALRSGRLAQPTIVRSRYQGFDYLHHMIPFEGSQTRCLLINESVPAPRWSGIRLLAMVLALLGMVALRMPK